MALITCPKCGNIFSEHAAQCPQCGLATHEIDAYNEQLRKEEEAKLAEKERIRKEREETIRLYLQKIKTWLGRYWWIILIVVVIAVGSWLMYILFGKPAETNMKGVSHTTQIVSEHKHQSNNHTQYTTTTGTNTSTGSGIHHEYTDYGLVSIDSTTTQTYRYYYSVHHLGKDVESVYNHVAYASDLQGYARMYYFQNDTNYYFLCGEVYNSLQALWEYEQFISEALGHRTLYWDNVEILATNNRPKELKYARGESANGTVYDVVVGSFQGFSAAAFRAIRMCQLGYKDTFLEACDVSGTLYYRVIALSAKGNAAAKQLKNTLKGMGIDSWIWKHDIEDYR